MNYIFAAGYFIGALIHWRLAFFYMINDITYWNGKHRKPEPMDVVLSGLLSTLTAFIWPIFLIPYFLYHWTKPALFLYIDKKWSDR